MSFRFSGMVSDGVALHIEEKGPQDSALVDENGKEYLLMHHEGQKAKIKISLNMLSQTMFNFLA